jgi:hypothetical protein
MTLRPALVFVSCLLAINGARNAHALEARIEARFCLKPSDCVADILPRVQRSADETSVLWQNYLS